MVSVNGVFSFILQGNTYGNLALIREVGALWDNKERCWKLLIRGHPMNNTKQRKRLEAKLTELEERGVRFVTFREVERAS